jgi:hypothetical protein
VSADLSYQLEEVGPARICIVGELNPYGADPRFALYDEPAIASGFRLRTLVLGLERRTYLNSQLIERVNLCVGRWSADHAARRVRLILHRDVAPMAYLLLGRKVQRAFGFRPVDQVWSERLAIAGSPRSNYYVGIPHPSGRSRAWNDPALSTLIRDTLRSAVPEIPWGERT